MVSLKPYNTFRLDHYCESLVEIHSARDLHDLMPFNRAPLVLGGGSNMLFTKDVMGTVLLNSVRGKQVVEINDDHVIVKLGGGEVWHDAVLWAIENQLGGIENLSLIPGKCGAAPIQNIGAYGVELESVFERLDSIDLVTGEKVIFEKEECHFGYRNSVFKTEKKGRYFILNVYLKLTLPGYHKLHLSYGQIEKYLVDKNIDSPTIADISSAVIDIRRQKLPDPEDIPNCGSFFKNPIISIDQFEEISKDWDNMPSYPYSETEVKLAAGWLIEKCGWKGKRVGDVGCHKIHALVICNYGAPYGRYIEHHYRSIISSVRDKFAITLHPEVNVY